MGQAPFDQLAMTVWVVSESGSWTVRRETPASYPSSITPGPVACSQAEAVAQGLREDVVRAGGH